MNIDSKIKKALENEAAEIDQILRQEDTGLFSMLGSSFKGSMRWWFIIINIAVVLVSVALVWCGYKFFTVEAEMQTFWGILFVISFQFQLAGKQWITNEMNRNNVIREIKRVELAVAELKERLEE